MASLKTLSAALNLIDAKKQNLKKAFDDLQSLSSSSFSLPLLWPDLDSHFTSLHHSLTHRFRLLQTLESEKYPHHPSSSPSNSPHKDANFPPLTNDPPSNRNDNASAGVFPQNYVVPGSVMPGYKLSVLCEKMDGVGLMNHVYRHFKDRVKVQAELPGALRCAPEPGEMVLEALEGFHGLGNGGGLKNDGELRKMRRCCMMLMKQLRVANPRLSSKVREKALAVAREWKERLVSDNANTLVALGFFHLVAAFGLVSEFGVDELVEYSAAATVNEEFLELCRITGLTNRVPDIVQKLIDRGKHILAVKYVFEFNLADKIPPVALLKACVDESKKLAKRLSEEGKSLAEIKAREIHTLKSVIKIIENHKLESEYPRASLDQRIEQLKRQNSNMKRPAPASAAKPPQHQQQQQQQKRKIKKQKQQPSGFKRPRTSAPVGHAAVRMNVDNGNSTMHQYREPLVHPSGLLPEHPNPYMSSTAVPFGMVAPTPTISPYTGPSAGPYGIAGVPIGTSGSPSLGSFHINSEPHVPSGGIGLQYYYQTSYYSQ